MFTEMDPKETLKHFLRGQSLSRFSGHRLLSRNRITAIVCIMSRKRTNSTCNFVNAFIVSYNIILINFESLPYVINC